MYVYMVSSFIRCLHKTQSVHVYTYQYHNDDIISSVVVDCAWSPFKHHKWNVELQCTRTGPNTLGCNCHLHL